MALALQLLLAGMQNLGAIIALIEQAQASGTDVSAADLQALISADLSARAKVAIAIAAAKRAGK